MPVVKAKSQQVVQHHSTNILATREPVWKGPEVDGVTQSLLSRYLTCKERFRLLVIEGFCGWR